MGASTSWRTCAHLLMRLVFISPLLVRDPSKHFSMGPLTSRGLWKSTKKDVKLDRGPCQLFSDDIFM